MSIKNKKPTKKETLIMKELKTRKCFYISFTYNNYTDAGVEELKNYENAQYLLLGFEVAPETKTPHIQGFIQLKKRKTCYSFMNDFSFQFYVIPSKASAISNYDYCTKDKNYYEKGTLIKQGRRTDLKNIREDFMETNSIKETLERNPNHSYVQLRYLENIAKYYSKTRDNDFLVEWFYGPTGSGKTRAAKARFENKNYFMQTQTGFLKWWDGYDGQEYIIIDELRPSSCSYSYLLGLLNKFNKFTVETKGSTREILTKHIIITSSYKPDNDFVYQSNKIFIKDDKDIRNACITDSLAQLLRRIDNIVEFRYFAVELIKYKGIITLPDTYFEDTSEYVYEKDPEFNTLSEGQTIYIDKFCQKYIKPKRLEIK